MVRVQQTRVASLTVFSHDFELFLLWSDVEQMMRVMRSYKSSRLLIEDGLVCITLSLFSIPRKISGEKSHKQ